MEVKDNINLLEEDKELLIQANKDFWKNLNKEEYGNSLVLKFMPFYFDRGWVNGYNKYIGCFSLPKDIASKASYGSLDFQCTLLKIYDNKDNIIFESITDCYDDGSNILANVEFIDE